jgi:hypothetical protein
MHVAHIINLFVLFIFSSNWILLIFEQIFNTYFYRVTFIHVHQNTFAVQLYNPH